MGQPDDVAAAQRKLDEAEAAKKAADQGVKDAKAALASAKKGKGTRPDRRSFTGATDRTEGS